MDTDNNDVNGDLSLVNNTKKQFYEELATKRRKTRLDRAKEVYLELEDKDQHSMNDWLMDIAVDNADAIDLEASTTPMIDFLPNVLEDADSWDKMVGLSSGFWPVDNMAMGFAPGEMTIVAGQTSQGKTLFCLNIAARLALEGHKILFVTLEMTHKEVSSRLFQILSKLTDLDMAKIEAAAKNIIFQQQEKMNWKSIPLMARKAKDENVEIMFIDHLHYFVRGMDNTAEGLGVVTQEFKRVALKYELPIVLISHTRKVEKGKKNADISDLRGSSYIAQDADIVLMVSQDPDFKNKIFITLEKNRNRLKYVIGTRIGFDKEGLLIKDLPKDSMTISALNQNDVNFDPSKRSITTGSPFADTPPTSTSE